MYIYYMLVLLITYLNIAYYVAEANIRYDYQYNKESKIWLKFHGENKTWHEARKVCDAEGATLVSPLDEILRKTIIDYASSYGVSTVYTGVHATISPGVWQSIEGIPMQLFKNWLQTCSVDTSERLCTALQSTNMLVVACSQKHPFICYRRGSGESDLTPCGTIDRDYYLDKRTGSCYKFHGISQPWTKAYEICSAEGAYLSIINSDIESQVLKELFQINKNTTIDSDASDFASIGFLDWEHNRGFYTIHGDPLKDSGYMKWLQGEPNNPADFCGNMHFSGGLNDASCQAKVAFICEKEVNYLDDVYNMKIN